MGGGGGGVNLRELSNLFLCGLAILAKNKCRSIMIAF